MASWTAAAGVPWALFVYYQTWSATPFPVFVMFDKLTPEGPFAPTGALWLDYAKALGLAMMMLTVATATGRLALRRLDRHFASASEMLSLCAALGYGIMAYAALLLSTLQLLDRRFIVLGLSAAFLGALAGLSRPDHRAWLARWMVELRELFLSDTLRVGAGSILGIIILGDLVMAFTPEIFYDALVYHLGIPNYYLIQGGWAPIEHLTTKFPMSIQMLHLIGLALKDEMVTKLTHVFLMGTLVLGMLGLGLRFKRPLAGILSAVLFCLVPIAQMNVWTSGIELGVSLFGFFSALCFVFEAETKDRTGPWLHLSAVFAGLALASKYTVAYVPAAIGLCLLLETLRDRGSWVDFFSRGVVYCSIMTAVVLPWLIRNWFETGNPVFPFLPEFFGGSALEPWRYEIFKRENKGVVVHSAADALKWIWSISVKERTSLNFQGPMFLAALPLVAGALLEPRPPWIKRSTLYVSLFLAIGAAMTRTTRYLLPGLAMTACVIGYSFDRFLSDRTLWRRNAALAVLIIGSYIHLTCACILIDSNYKPREVLAGRESRESYISRYHTGMNTHPSIAMYRYLEQHPPSGKVLLVGEEKAYPIKVDHSYSGILDRGPLIRVCETSRSPKEAAEKLLGMGITHLMINVAEASRIAHYGIFSWSKDAFGLFGAFWQSHVSLEKTISVEAGGRQNLLLLMRVLPSAADPGVEPFTNPLAIIYEAIELPRLNIAAPEDRLRFYEDLLKSWSDVRHFKDRVAEIKRDLAPRQ